MFFFFGPMRILRVIGCQRSYTQCVPCLEVWQTVALLKYEIKWNEMKQTIGK